MEKENTARVLEESTSGFIQNTSKFIRRRADEIILIGNITTVGLAGFNSGMKFVNGEIDLALIWGIGASCSGIAAYLKGLSIIQENRTLRDQATLSFTPDLD